MSKVRASKVKASKSRVSVAFLMALAAVLATQAVFVFAQSVPDTVTVGSSTRHVESAGGVTVPAAAGNVSALVVTETRITNFWQGYFGNVTGTIVLDDGGNNTLFAWELLAPSGEIFAVNTTSTVQWANITCVNFTGRAPFNELSNGSDMINLTSLARQFNMNTTVANLENLSKDAFNSTFNTTFAGSFRVGTVDIGSSNNCPQVFPFVDDAYQQASFKEVLLHDNKSALVFAGLLENSKSGFQAGANDLADFQVLVAEDGTPGKEAASTYYFYVELE